MTTLFDRAAVADLVGEMRMDELTFEKALGLFETVYMASRNLTERTRAEYKRDVQQLVNFLGERGVTQPQKVSLAHLQAFLADLDTQGLAGVSRRRKVSSVKAFFGFLTTSDLVPSNPTLQLVPPEREHKEPRFLTTQEYRALLRACAHETRDAAIIELILQTGMRLSEVARLAVHDIELPVRINREPDNTGSIFVQGKGRKSRTLPLNHKACRALKAWLAVRPDIDDPALFVTKFREPMGARTIQNIVKKYLAEAGIKNASVHTLRHTFATHHVAKGTDLRTVQETLGHADLKTTSIYVSTAKEAMKRDLQDHAL